MCSPRRIRSCRRPDVARDRCRRRVSGGQRQGAHSHHTFTGTRARATVAAVRGGGGVPSGCQGVFSSVRTPFSDVARTCTSLPPAARDDDDVPCVSERALLPLPCSPRGAAVRRFTYHRRVVSVPLPRPRVSNMPLIIAVIIIYNAARFVTVLLLDAPALEKHDGPFLAWSYTTAVKRLLFFFFIDCAAGRPLRRVHVESVNVRVKFVFSVLPDFRSAPPSPTAIAFLRRLHNLKTRFQYPRNSSHRYLI